MATIGEPWVEQACSRRARTKRTMDKILIEGGAPLRGEIQVNGAKNAALLIQCASLLSQHPSTIRRCPALTDVRTMNRLLSHLGCQIELSGSCLQIDPSQVGHGGLEAPYDLVKTMRASVTVMGPLLSRHGRARISLPGGCAIGARPIDQHLRGLEALGAKVELVHGYVQLSANRLVGTRFNFDKVTVGGTQNLMMAATLARGTTVLENVAREPEVRELAIVLNKMGARISGAGTSTIEIEGVEELYGIDHAVMPDRIEAGTLIIAATVTKGDVLVRDAPVDDMHAVLSKLEDAGVILEPSAEGLRVRGPDSLRPIDLETRPHPGFPTDMQAQMMLLATQADGQSIITESIFENRFMHVPELNRLGADVIVNGSSAIVRGPTPLSGTSVMCTDLRASASLVLAGLIASGRTELRRVYHLDRGYASIETRLKSLGANIQRISGGNG